MVCIVTTNCAEMANFVSRNKVGLIAEDNVPSLPHSLADRILQLVEDKALYDQLRGCLKSGWLFYEVGDGFQGEGT